MWNAHRVPVVDLKAIAKVLEKAIKAKTKQLMRQKRGEISLQLHWWTHDAHKRV